MALFSRPNSVTAPSAQPERGPTPAAKLDIPLAIQAHVSWKLKLQTYINGTNTEPLNAETASCDDKCVLGQWIYNHGLQHYSDHPTFMELKEIHGHFHRCAGSIIRHVDCGELELAQQALTQGDFPKYSGQIKARLASLCLEFAF